MKLSNSFIISIAGIASLLTLGLVKDVDVSMAISGVVLSYVGARSAQKTGIVFASSKDSTSNTDQVIKDMEGK